MATVSFGANIEFVRHADKSFEWGMAKAAELGFEYVEPMVHWGRELLSEAGYFHSVSMLDDPSRVRRAAERNGLKISALSAHSPLCHPDISTDYLTQAVRFANECGAPFVITDDGTRRPAWTTEAENRTLMRYVLEAATAACAERDVTIALETHGPYTSTPEHLAATLALVDSPKLAINFDTGNAFLSGNDPYEWLTAVIDRTVHVHAKDISEENAARYRGKVHGMLGCACGDGVIDWRRILEICESAPHDLVLSVECDTIDDAARSLEHLSTLKSAV
jgi:sugar phosphate isomerase/epimerase